VALRTQYMSRRDPDHTGANDHDFSSMHGEALNTDMEFELCK
jgi:hypothetical protein